MVRRAARVSAGGSREFLTITIAPRTRARIDALATATGKARGRLVDIAIGNLAACEACRGTGALDGRYGAATERCEACAGQGLLPG